MVSNMLVSQKIKGTPANTYSNDIIIQFHNLSGFNQEDLWDILHQKIKSELSAFGYRKISVNAQECVAGRKC